MSFFDLKSHLDSIYASYPEAKRRPIIGITANFNDGEATMAKVYYQQVVDAGGTPVLMPPVADKDVIINTLDIIDGLLLTGGADFNPLWNGEEPSPALHRINSTRDLPELLTIRLAYNRQIPILGICRGIQALAVALDGHVMQDIETDKKYTLVPADSAKCAKLAIIVKHLWFDAYNEVAGIDFLKQNAPRVLTLVGSPAYNSEGTMVLGTAEGGYKLIFKTRGAERKMSWTFIIDEASAAQIV